MELGNVQDDWCGKLLENVVCVCVSYVGKLSCAASLGVEAHSAPVKMVATLVGKGMMGKCCKS